MPFSTISNQPALNFRRLSRNVALPAAIAFSALTCRFIRHLPCLKIYLPSGFR